MATKQSDSGVVNLTSDKHMEATATLDDQGHVLVRTHLWTESDLWGFTGGSFATFSDANGSVVAKTQLNSYGIDGQDIFWSDVAGGRWVDYTATVDPSVFTNTNRIDVFCLYTPRNRFWDDLIDVLGIGYDIAEWIWTHLHSGGTDGGPDGGPDGGDTDGYGDDFGDEGEALTGTIRGIWNGATWGDGYCQGVGVPLQAPTLDAPADGAPVVGFPRYVEFSWAAVDGANAYAVVTQIGDTDPESGWGSMGTRTTSATSMTFVWPGDNLGRWAVVALDQTGMRPASPQSAWRTFTCESAPPMLSAPTPVAPAADASISLFPAETTFTWQPVSGADAYILEVQQLKVELPVVVVGPIVQGPVHRPVMGGVEGYGRGGKPPLLREVMQTTYAAQVPATTANVGLLEASDGRWRVLAIDTTRQHQMSAPSAWTSFKAPTLGGRFPHPFVRIVK